MKPSVHTQYWQNRYLPGVEISRVTESSHIFPRHFHDRTYSFGLMEKGACYCLQPGDRGALTTTGHVALINPGQVHTGIPAGGRKVSYTMVYLAESLFQSLYSEISGGDRTWEFSHLLSGTRELRAKMEHLSRLVIGSLNPMELEASLLSAIACLVSDGTDGPRETVPSRGNTSMHIAAEMLRSDLTQPMSLEQLAGYLGISRYHFLRSFKKSFGVTPHVYRVQARLEAAKVKIHKGIPLAEVAVETGFADQSHFSKTFRHYMGATPLQYASASRG